MVAGSLCALVEGLMTQEFWGDAIRTYLIENNFLRFFLMVSTLNLFMLVLTLLTLTLARMICDEFKRSTTRQVKYAPVHHPATQVYDDEAISSDSDPDADMCSDSEEDTDLSSEGEDTSDEPLQVDTQVVTTECEDSSEGESEDDSEDGNEEDSDAVSDEADEDS
ncbi:hypothetical protein [Carp edema virus]|nr:hypothetical protein [Carp edema virus]